MAHQVLASPSMKVRVMPPMLRGFLWAGIAFLLTNSLVASIRPDVGHPFVNEVSITIGWVAALTGWLLGVGAYEGVVLPLFGVTPRIGQATDWRRYFAFATDHKVVGIQYLASSAAAFILAGSIAMAMRIELASPTIYFFHYSDQYLAAVGVHGTIMMFAVATVALVGGMGNYMVPLMIGAKNTVFPRLSGLGHWLIPAGVLTVAMSPLLGYWTTGWRGYEPLGSQDPSGIIFYYLGVAAMALSSTIVSLNMVTTIVFNRAPGLTWPRLPMYVWGVLTVSILNLIWLPEIQMTFILELLDRLVPLNLFNAAGQPLAELELFWLFGHPEVYIIVVPGFALWNEIIPVMAQKSLFGRSWAVIGLIFVMMLSGMVWAHHMFTNMRNSEILPFAFFTEMISIPTGFGYMAAIGTLWQSRYRLTTPGLLVLMSMFNFLLGGISGVYLADPPVNLQVHDTMFIVAHFHYTIIGGMIFTWIAATYYWLPKISGRLYSEFWGKFLSIWIFIAFNTAFSTMFLVGLEGMNRWVPAYPPYLHPLNLVISLAAWALGTGFVLHAVHIVWAWRKGPPAPDNPWNGRTLEWLTSSPPPPNNFAEVPIIDESFYVYGDAVKPAARNWDRLKPS
ncbi:MAG: cbb3-type cytochrome c oxidase subunit I [Firmicutes bacterium]|nr:cbb3-type cytochrome c oxidase subunit I [Bacillota bacterium]